MGLDDYQGTNATLGGTATVAAIDGVATFSGLTLSDAGDDWDLSVSATGGAGTVTTPFDVNAAPATQLQAAILPEGSITAGSSFTMIVWPKTLKATLTLHSIAQ